MCCILRRKFKMGLPSVDNNPSQTKEVVRFKNASFRFADADENTLEDLNFTCRRGETTAIIGSTGSGKSTIAKLILRFHDVTSGSVLLNGKDIRNMTQKGSKGAYFLCAAKGMAVFRHDC